MSTATDVVIDEKIANKISEPTKYNVIFLNDDQTPMDWVIDLLTEIFKHSQDSAKRLTLTVHTEGSAVVGTYTHEIAEQKMTEAINASRSNGFPLRIKMETE